MNELQNVQVLEDGRYVHLTCGHTWYPRLKTPTVCPLCHCRIKKIERKLVLQNPGFRGWHPVCEKCGSATDYIFRFREQNLCKQCLDEEYEKHKPKPEDALKKLLDISE